MKRIDNKTTFLKDDLKETIKKGGKISIAAAYFSMYAWQELKKEMQVTIINHLTGENRANSLGYRADYSLLFEYSP